MKTIPSKKEKARGLDIYSKKHMTKVLKIKDIYNRIYEVKKIDEFIDHINKYHSVGNSIHEENGFYFEINDSFRDSINFNWAIIFYPHLTLIKQCSVQLSIGLSYFYLLSYQICKDT